jgi:hypothetical protein
MQIVLQAHVHVHEQVVYIQAVMLQEFLCLDMYMYTCNVPYLEFEAHPD